MKKILFLSLIFIVINTVISQDSPHCTWIATVTEVKSGDVLKVDDGTNKNEIIKLRNIEIIKPNSARDLLNGTILEEKICLECDGSGNLGGLLCDVYKVMPKNSIWQKSINRILIDYGFARFKSDSGGNNIEPNPPGESIPTIIKKSGVPVFTSNSSPSEGQAESANAEDLTITEAKKLDKTN